MGVLGSADIPEIMYQPSWSQFNIQHNNMLILPLSVCQLSNFHDSYLLLPGSWRNCRKKKPSRWIRKNGSSNLGGWGWVCHSSQKYGRFSRTLWIYVPVVGPEGTLLSIQQGHKKTAPVYPAIEILPDVHFSFAPPPPRIYNSLSGESGSVYPSPTNLN